MSIAAIFAHLFGIVFLVLGASMIFNKKWTAHAIEEIFKNAGMVWTVGFITLLLGASVVALQNDWSTTGLPYWITVLGWLTLLKGTTILLFPHFTHRYYKKVYSGNILLYGGIIVLILGAVFLLQ